MYTMLLISGLLLAALMLGISATQPAAQAQADFDCSAVTGVTVEECEGLVALYTATGGENWTNKTNWLQTNTPCNWAGVTCNGGRVSWLSLYENRLTGALPPEIGNFTAMTGIYLGNNQLTSLPPQIGSLTALTWTETN